MNHSNRYSSHISEAKVVMVIEAAAHAFRLGMPLNYTVTLHLDGLGVTRPHAFISDFFSHFGDSLRGTSARPCWAWVLENGIGKGLHLHGAMHVPPVMWRKFPKLVRAWVRQCLRTTGSLGKGVRVKKMDFAGNPLSTSYLGVWWRRGWRKCGLKGWLGYVLKGAEPAVAAKFGIQPRYQGIVSNKRCGASEAINQKSRKSFRYAPGGQAQLGRVRISSEARLLISSGFCRSKNYQP